MSLVLRDLLINLSASVIFAFFVVLFRRLAPSLYRKSPRLRPLALLSVAIVWLLANLAYLSSTLGAYPIFFLSTSLIVGYMIGDELYRYWSVGIIGADPKLEDGLSYKGSLALCQRSLDFLGVGAAKLTRVQPEFEQALSRCNSAVRPIRFLLCDPDNDRLEIFARQAGDRAGEYRRRIIESLRVLADLRNRKAINLEVRFYSSTTMPFFRLMFIDEFLCLASHYEFGRGEGAQLPQVHIRRASPGRPEATSLYYVFDKYFKDLWESSMRWDFVSKLR